MARAGNERRVKRSRTTQGRPVRRVAKSTPAAKMMDVDATSAKARVAQPRSKVARGRVARGKSVSAPSDSQVAKLEGIVADDTLLKGTDWVELHPQGISVGGPVGRPILILKDQHGVEVLPVWMQSIDAGVALAELSQGSGASPHGITRRVMQALNLKIESCVFVELIGHHQYVVLKFSGHPAVKSLRVRADEAMSFCLQGRAKFYGTRTYMARCRDMDAELTRLENGLNQGILPGLQAELEISSKKHPYVM